MKHYTLRLRGELEKRSSSYSQRIRQRKRSAKSPQKLREIEIHCAKGTGTTMHVLVRVWRVVFCIMLAWVNEWEGEVEREECEGEFEGEWERERERERCATGDTGAHGRVRLSARQQKLPPRNVGEAAFRGGARARDSARHLKPHDVPQHESQRPTEDWRLGSAIPKRETSPINTRRTTLIGRVTATSSTHNNQWREERNLIWARRTRDSTCGFRCPDRQWHTSRGSYTPITTISNQPNQPNNAR